jgi:dihydroxy-acid dehydratase
VRQAGAVRGAHLPRGLGPWSPAYVQDGDPIEMNVPECRIQLLVADEQLRRRQENPVARPAHPAPGILAAYRRMVGGADSGAVWL